MFCFTIENFLRFSTSPNTRLHHFTLARNRRNLKAFAYTLAYNERRRCEDLGETFPWGRVNVNYTLRTPYKSQKEPPDRDNIVAAAKPVLDALCVCRANRGGVGVIADDRPSVVLRVDVLYAKSTDIKTPSLEVQVLQVEGS